MANNKSAEKRIKTNERNRLKHRFIKLQFEL
jgi:ribosomal protein S20